MPCEGANMQPCHAPHATQKPSSKWGPYRTVVAAIIALILLAGGVSIANRNSSAGMHQKIAQGYQQCE
jgi:hypothetical protein